MMHLINHIEFKHKTKLQKFRGGTNCVAQAGVWSFSLHQSFAAIHPLGKSKMTERLTGAQLSVCQYCEQLERKLQNIR